MSAFMLAATIALQVPFVPQEKDTCAAASLAMVLRYWDLPASQDEIANALLEPQLHGIVGSRLMAFAQQRGLKAVAYAGDAAHLREFLGKGRPLIVAWKMAQDRYHNVVVVGLDEDRNTVLVNDPAVGAARAVAASTFEKRWAGSGHWTLLVLPSSK